MGRFFNGITVAFVLTYISTASLGLAGQTPATKGAAKAAALKNPVASTPASIAAGQASFQKYCRFCHGADAKGDGPQAPKDTHPPNLTDEKWDHGSTDAEIFTIDQRRHRSEIRHEGLQQQVDASGNVEHRQLSPQPLIRDSLTVAASPRCTPIQAAGSSAGRPRCSSSAAAVARLPSRRRASAGIGVHAGALVAGRRGERFPQHPARSPAAVSLPAQHPRRPEDHVHRVLP